MISSRTIGDVFIKPPEMSLSRPLSVAPHDDAVEERRRQIVAALRQSSERPDRLHSEPMSAAARLISVVEDEDTIREMVCLALGKEGYRTEAFDDGARAWEALRTRAARPRHPRHRPAAARRPGDLPAAARAVGRSADHLRDLARGGVRSRARARDRRRRLPVQAVLDARADGAGQSAPATRDRRRRRRRVRTKISPSSAASCRSIRSG